MSVVSVTNKRYGISFFTKQRAGDMMPGSGSHTTVVLVTKQMKKNDQFTWVRVNAAIASKKFVQRFFKFNISDFWLRASSW